jgi:Family of unknown function (DUF6516)
MLNKEEHELESLLWLDGATFEMTPGIIVEFTARRIDATPERPHGTSYAIVLRPKAGGLPWLRFDNAHGVAGRARSRGYGPKKAAYDHWHRTEKDKGRPYTFTTASQLLDDFWREVKRIFDEKGIPHNL